MAHLCSVADQYRETAVQPGSDDDELGATTLLCFSCCVLLRFCACANVRDDADVRHLSICVSWPLCPCSVCGRGVAMQYMQHTCTHIIISRIIGAAMEQQRQLEKLLLEDSGLYCGVFMMH